MCLGMIVMLAVHHFNVMIVNMGSTQTLLKIINVSIVKAQLSLVIVAKIVQLPLLVLNVMRVSI